MANTKKFEMPAGDFSENEKKGLEALAKHLTDQFGEFAGNSITKDEALDKMEESINKWAKDSGISKEKMDGIMSSLKIQGEQLTKWKEQATGSVKLTGLKGAFNKQFDALKQAIKEKRSGLVLKAEDDDTFPIDVHDEDLIHTTGVSITGDTFMPEQVGSNPDLFLKRQDRQYIHDIANVSIVGEVPEVFTFEEEGDSEGTIAVVEENAIKPQVFIGLVKNQVAAQKAAGYIVVTEEMMKWRSRGWAAIQRLFRDKVYRDYENLLTTQLLTGASSYVQTPLDGTIVAPTDFDALIAAVLQLEMLNYQPNVLVINPADKWKLAMTTTPNGMLILPYIQNGGDFGLLGLRVITTNAMDSGEFLVGESGTWFIEEESPRLRTGLVNDDLIHNRMTLVGEIFFLSYIPSNNAGAWLLGEFEDIKETLTAEEEDGGQG